MLNANLIKISRLAFRNIFRNPRRSAYTLLLAAAGFAAIVIARGYFEHAVYGLQELTIRNGYAGTTGTGHLEIVNAKGLENDESYPLEFGLAQHEKIVEALREDERVDYVMRRIRFGGLASNGDESLPFMGYGIEAEPEMELRSGLGMLREELQFLGDEIEPLVENPQGVLLGRALAQSLGLSVGDAFMLMGTTVDGAVNAVDVELAGLLTTGADATDSYFLLTNMGTAQSLINTEKVSSISVMLKNRDDLEHTVASIATTLPRQSDGSRAIARGWEELGTYYRAVKDLFGFMFVFLQTIIITIAIISVWNIMNMATMERIKEIGTLRAIGLPIQHITGTFMLEGFFLGLAGVVLGLLLQVAIVTAINMAQIEMPPAPGGNITYNLRVYTFTDAHPIVAVLIVAALTISSLSAFFTLRKLSIVEALESA